ncbi:uncharacterized protein [Amphiura filiformis]|uniref:uncharacterized protein n=1 Tax=Amphiura filiformis TaxID=82378 RepID=UPI003B218EF0
MDNQIPFQHETSSNANDRLGIEVEIFMTGVLQQVEETMEDLYSYANPIMVPCPPSSSIDAMDHNLSDPTLKAQVKNFLDDVLEKVDEALSLRQLQATVENFLDDILMEVDELVTFRVSSIKSFLSRSKDMGTEVETHDTSIADQNSSTHKHLNEVDIEVQIVMDNILGNLKDLLHLQIEKSDSKPVEATEDKDIGVWKDDEQFIKSESLTIMTVGKRTTNDFEQNDKTEEPEIKKQRCSFKESEIVFNKVIDDEGTLSLLNQVGYQEVVEVDKHTSQDDATYSTGSVIRMLNGSEKNDISIEIFKTNEEHKTEEGINMLPVNSMEGQQLDEKPNNQANNTTADEKSQSEGKRKETLMIICMIFQPRR